MEELVSVMTSVGTLMAVVAGGLSVISLCYAGILWMTASGDPQKMGQARMALMGAIGGLVIVGIAFIVPRVISQVILEPVGGVALTSDTGFDCDTVLRQQLVFQRAASNESRINQVISRIQAQNSDTCSADVWNPRANDGNYVNAPRASTRVNPGSLAIDEAEASELADGPPPDGVAGCWAVDVLGVDSSGDAFDSSLDATGRDATVGSTMVPASLRNGNNLDSTVRDTSGRDSQNNVIIYWASSSEERPADNSRCWLYVRSLRTWDETY